MSIINESSYIGQSHEIIICPEVKIGGEGGSYLT